jgi:hypothetical protein
MDGNEGDGKIDFMNDRKQILSMGARWKLAQHHFLVACFRISSVIPSGSTAKFLIA